MVLLLLVSLWWGAGGGGGGRVLWDEEVLWGYLLLGSGVPCGGCEGFVLKSARYLRFSVTCDSISIYQVYK